MLSSARLRQPHPKSGPPPHPPISSHAHNTQIKAWSGAGKHALQWITHPPSPTNTHPPPPPLPHPPATQIKAWSEAGRHALLVEHVRGMLPERSEHFVYDF